MKFLIIQTAFIGDVVLATPLAEQLRKEFPTAEVDFLVRKGNESLLTGNPNISRILVFNKKQNKYKHLLKLIKDIRKENYDYVINLQRFFTTGLITTLSGATGTIGFNKNPLSFLFSHSIKHKIDLTNGLHEVDRNLSLLQPLGIKAEKVRPKLFPSPQDHKAVETHAPYICIAPSSVWVTKQFPPQKWIELLDLVPQHFTVYLLGSKDDLSLCTFIENKTIHKNVKIKAGEMSFLESAALMKGATMNFVNDSAPMHFASAVNAPVTAVFCSTIPEFGFGPLSDYAHIAQTDLQLECKPCGLHGRKECPLKHFKCADIDVEKMLKLSGII